MNNQASGRRRVLALGGVALAALGVVRSRRASAATDGKQGGNVDEELRAAAARQEIMALRHGYAIATDLIGKNREPDVAEGLGHDDEGAPAWAECERCDVYFEPREADVYAADTAALGPTGP